MTCKAMSGISLRGVTKRFGSVVAVDNISLEIEKGSLYFLLGPSGCGKTTLLRIIAGFYRPDAGRLFSNSLDITDLPPHKRNTGMVFQNYALWPHMSVWKNVEYGLKIRGVSESEKRSRVGKALEIVQMGSYAERSPNQLSGGQQQRIALARALVIEPNVVLLDEPLSNLDAKLRIEMRMQIKRIHSDLGITMIYVTHDQKEALSMADGMAILKDGLIVQTGAPREVYRRPGNRFVADFVGETNFLDGVVSGVKHGIAVDTPAGLIFAEIGRALSHEGQTTIAGPGSAPKESGPGRARIGPEASIVVTPPAGKRVTCSVRPEAIRIVSVGHPEGTLVEHECPSRDPQGEMCVAQGWTNILQGEVVSAMYLGDNEQYSVRIEGGAVLKVVEHHPTQRKADIGDHVTLSFMAEDVAILES